MSSRQNKATTEVLERETQNENAVDGGVTGLSMELVWNNPSPNRTAHRPLVWELLRRNGTSRVISDNEVQAMADRKLVHGANEALTEVQTAFAAYFCF